MLSARQTENMIRSEKSSLLKKKDCLENQFISGPRHDFKSNIGKTSDKNKQTWAVSIHYAIVDLRRFIIYPASPG